MRRTQGLDDRVTLDGLQRAEHPPGGRHRIGWQVRQLDHPGAPICHHLEQHPTQLFDVARPPVAHEQPHRFRSAGPVISTVVGVQSVEGTALSMLVHNHVNRIFQCVAERAPGFGDRRLRKLKDLAAITGGAVYSKHSGFTLETMTIDQLGRAAQVRVTENNTTVVDGAGSVADVEFRVTQLRGARPGVVRRRRGRAERTDRGADRPGRGDPGGRADAGLGKLVGGGAALAFAVSRLASGLSSSSVGTYAGQVVMRGFIRRRIPLFLRRGLTMLPALVALGIGLPTTECLVASQIVLSSASHSPRCQWCCSLAERTSWDHSSTARSSLWRRAESPQ